MNNVNDILNLTQTLKPKDEKLITRAFEFAQKIHKDQRRSSGDPYFVHVVETAKILAMLNMDAKTIAGGLLHDVVEDSEITEKILEKEFGKEVMFLVGGVTKLGKYKYTGLKRHTESLRKFLLATSKDVRVLIIRLADRLHNMRTLKHVREDKQKRTALETLEIYAPLADRLGIGQVKGELEDLAFPYVYPKEYEETSVLHRQLSKDAKKRLEKIFRSLHKKMKEVEINPIGVDYRIKHIYSTYKKLLKYDHDAEKIYDIAALRIIVSSIEECYRVLGLIHGRWTPLPGRIKDYISTPKTNGYQSLHTTIFVGDGGIVEIQIRTKQMHQEAEFGIAAHLSYKEGFSQRKNPTLGKKLAWIEQLADWQRNIQESGEFIDNLKMDLFKDRVFIFTPNGDVIDLPEDSCSIDFAYAIHSDIGNSLSGAKINNKLCSLSTKLKNGDIVEILNKKNNTVTIKWLEYAKTPLARKHIRMSLQKKQPANF